MMQSIALNPAVRTGDRRGPTARSRAVPVSRPRSLTVTSVTEPSSCSIVDLDDPRDGARTVVLALVAAAVVAFVLATLLFASALNASTRDLEAATSARTTGQSTPALTTSGPTVSIPTGPALFVMLAQGQD